jgi:hypothetical protein
MTQRGNRRSQTFFEDGDYELHRDLPGESFKPGSKTHYLSLAKSFPRPSL